MVSNQVNFAFVGAAVVVLESVVPLGVVRTSIIDVGNTISVAVNDREVWRLSMRTKP